MPPLIDDLTTQQFEMAEFIAGYRERNDGLSPSYAEIAEALGICHRSNVREKLQRLIAKGYIEQAPGVPRSLKTTGKWELRRRREFGLAANPLVMQVVQEHPEEFHGWKPEQFDSLLSRRACGGELTEAGVLHEARKMNENETALNDCSALLEVDEAREVILQTLNELKERHTPGKRRRRRRARMEDGG